MSIHETLKAEKATLHLPQGNQMCYIQVGKYRFYFHSEEPKLEEYDTMGGKQTKMILEYDGYEGKA